MSSGINMSSRPYSKIGTAGNNERDSNSPSAGLMWCIAVCPAVGHLSGNDNFCKLSNVAFVSWHQMRAVLACRTESCNGRANSYK